MMKKNDMKEWIKNLFSLNHKDYLYQGWEGNFVDAYFDDLEKGEWVDISYIKYKSLKSRGFIVRKTLKEIGE